MADIGREPQDLVMLATVGFSVARGPVTLSKKVINHGERFLSCSRSGGMPLYAVAGVLDQFWNGFRLVISLLEVLYFLDISCQRVGIIIDHYRCYFIVSFWEMVVVLGASP